jgi:hypothetical protein
MACNFLIIRSGLVDWLVLDKIHSAIPFACADGRLNRFIENVGLDEVLNRKVELLLRNEPVSPLLLKVNNGVRENLLGYVNCLAECVTHDVRFQSTIMDVHLFEEITCFLVHSGSDKLAGNLFELVVGDVHLVA